MQHFPNFLCLISVFYINNYIQTHEAIKIATQITNRDSQAVEKYLQEISKIAMITPEEETIFAQKIKMGDQRALERSTANLRFVVSVAKQYQHQGLSLSDLINEGNLGLNKSGTTL